MSEEEKNLEERRITKRVSSKGKITKKVKCKKGFKSKGGKCVPISGSEKRTRKKAARKATRTRKQNPSTQRKASKKRLKALKRRKGYGL